MGFSDMNAVQIEHMEIEKRQAILTSDIHGHLFYLKKVLEKAHFSDEDILIIIGDIIEKGLKALKHCVM